jgi:23S rRNA pseudouridine1911/1915/1917 synthase
MKHDLFSLQIIDETDDLLIVNKPPFLLVHPTKPGGPITLWNQLKELLCYEIANGGQIGLINRLDRETSGLMLITKNKSSARTCSMAMERGAIKKEYQALLYGYLTPDKGSIDAPLLRLSRVEAYSIWLKQGIHHQGMRDRIT